MDLNKIPEYQNGAEGFIKFIESNVKFSVPQQNSPVPKWIYPTELSDKPHSKTGKSFKEFWDYQKSVFREALRMENGQFKYRTLVFCWPRGEGKSLMVCLIQLWKFFCFPRQLIVFGALSKDQTRFVHYDMIQSVIMNSPKLLNVIGKANIQRQSTVLKNRKGEVVSSFQPISSYSGIVSNITGYTFSEMFDLKDPKFFTQLDGSTRNIVNALGTIDSTVSTKEHVLYRLYKTYQAGADKLTFFHYRSAPNAEPDEFWHPLMDKDQLQSYQHKFPPADFDRYFRNLWDLESGKLFSEPLVKSIFYIGYTGENNEVKLDDGTVLETYNQIHEIQAKSDSQDGRKNKRARQRRPSTVTKEKETTAQKLEKLSSILVPTDNIYTLSKYSIPKPASNSDLEKLGNIFDTNWSIHAGIDRSDPLARDSYARTIVTVVAKGLTGSRSRHNIVFEDKEVPEYIYFLLHLAWVEDATLEGIKKELQEAYAEYDGIDTLCSERWGAWDLAPWCEELDIDFEAVFPSYDKQKKAFSELYLAVRHSRFKSANIVVPGHQSENILEEELKMFDYHPQSKWYGSPQKNEKEGVQDDSVFSLAWCIYGGREYGVNEFRERKTQADFGVFIPSNNNYAEYNL